MGKLTNIEKYTPFKDIQLKERSGVYIIFNKINNKYYIGGALDFCKRFRCHLSDLLRNKHQNQHLQNAVNFYGINNFEFDILEEYPPQLAFYMEDYWTNLLNARNREYGYNMRGVREGRPGKHSKASIDKMLVSQSKRIQLRKDLGLYKGGKYKKMDPEIKKASRIKMSTENFGKKIIQLSPTGKFIKEWESIHQSARSLDILPMSISDVLRHNKKSAKNFIFVYKEEYREDKDYKIERNYGKYLQKVVHMYSLENKFIKSFLSINDASQETGINRSGISNQLSGRSKTAGGFIWKY